LLVVLSGCKYEDGPFLSLRSKQERVVNEWKLETYLRNGQEATDALLMHDYTETYTHEHTFIRTYTLPNTLEQQQSGTWQFSDNKQHLLIEETGHIPLTRQDSPLVTRQLTLLKLKENELWYQVMEGDSTTHEFHLVSR
jgi:hypothetical protein